MGARVSESRLSTDPSLSAAHARTDRHLRWLDLTLASLALLLLSVPLLLAWRVGRLERKPQTGEKGRRFERLSLCLPEHWPGRWLRACAAPAWPVLFNILRGEMAWVGPRPRAWEDAQPAPLVRPGLVNSWFICQRTAVDFGSEAQADAQDLLQRSLRHDAGVLLRAVLAACLPAPALAVPGQVLLCDVPFHNLNMNEALARLRDLLDGTTPQQVCFVNPACVNIAARQRGYRRTLHRAALVLPDGIGTKIASDLLGTPLKQNVNGTDLFPRLCDMLAARQAKVFLLGGRPEVVARVAQVMGQRWPGLEVVGWRDGYFSVTQEGEVAQQVCASGADFLLVARGVPSQDLFIDRHLPLLGVKVAMGVGGLFDFVSGRIARAPVWMREIGLEWVWRLLQEPGRMWKRYLLGNVTFLARVLLQRSGWRQPAADVRVMTAADRLAAAQTGAAAAASASPASGVCAVLMATARAHPSLPVRPDCPAGLLPLGHHSLLERQIDTLAAAAVTDIHLLICDRPAALRQLLGDGERWGVRLHWHVLSEPEHALALLRRPELQAARRVLIGDVGHWLPVDAMLRLANRTHTAWASAEPADAAAPTDQTAQAASATLAVWAGWASVAPQALKALSGATNLPELQAALLALGNEPLLLPASDCVLPQAPAGLLQTQRRLLARELALPLPGAWVQQPWGVMSPQAQVHAWAQIQGPVMIGPGCVVEAGAQIGPNTLLSRDVVVAAGASVQGSLVWPGSFIGPGVALAGCIVNGARLHVVPGGSAQGLESPGALGTLNDVRGLGSGLLGRGMAALAWVLMGCGVLGPACWRQHHHALWAIAAGRLRWFGVRPRSAADWQALHSEWRALLEATPVGWLHEPAWVEQAQDRLEAEAAADAFYAVNAGWREHVRLLRVHVCRCLRRRQGV